jgi:2-methylcitrate dehydratase PrpD
MTAGAAADNRFTRGIAEFVSALRYEAIPPEVTRRAQLLMLDAFGCALYASHLPHARILMDTLATIDPCASCTVWGTDRRLSAPHAALVNGTLVQGFELDDVHRQAVMHPASVTLPAVFAVAETRPGMTGRDLLTAMIAGYEVGPRVGMCMGQEHIGQGWHSGATTGVFAASAGASRALGLSPEQTVHALGIAGTQASGLMAAQYGAMVKRMHAGRAAQSGLYGALLAGAGFTGITDVLESEYGGFCTTFSRSRDRFDLNELTGGLGERWETLRVSLKFYACVASNHTTLDALRALRAERPFGADDIERIVVHAARVTVDHAGWPYRPEGLTAAQLNLSYCVATLLLEDDVFVDQFTEPAVSDARRMALATRVEVREDPAITARGSRFRHTVRVEVHLRGGTRLDATVEAARGSEQHFAGEEEIVEKFTKLASHTLSPRRVEALRDAVLDLPRIGDATMLARLLGQVRSHH